MKREWWALLITLVVLTAGYLLIQGDGPLRFDFLTGYIFPVVLILFGDIIGTYLARILPRMMSRLLLGGGASNPGLFLRLLGWVALFGKFVLALLTG